MANLDYLVKPFDPDDALVVVERALGRKQVRGRLEQILRDEARAVERGQGRQESRERILRRYGIIVDCSEGGQ